MTSYNFFKLLKSHTVIFFHFQGYRFFNQMNKHSLETRDKYLHFTHIQTRWMDNDIYGHVNNVTYYPYFDTVVNNFLIDVCDFNPHEDEVVGIVVETMCSFKKPISFPDQINLGLRIRKLGKTSIRYEVGVFREGENEASCLLYTSPSPRDRSLSRMPSSA